MHLNFSMTWLYPSDSYYRAFGFQLRCLSEETEPPPRASAMQAIMGDWAHRWAAATTGTIGLPPLAGLAACS
ncbi:hypothetical protein [uncultured Rikenella sp.]|uniref:hypothetical protein n=1 Tax=uncultured Rikenella sp. TaxID=368003 RepID=UPI0025DF6B72|nr:hypothetical protein [uncultured Rikenella sp.]